VRRLHPPTFVATSSLESRNPHVSDETHTRRPRGLLTAIRPRLRHPDPISSRFEASCARATAMSTRFASLVSAAAAAAVAPPPAVGPPLFSVAELESCHGDLPHLVELFSSRRCNHPIDYAPRMGDPWAFIPVRFSNSSTRARPTTLLLRRTPHRHTSSNPLGRR
jgi:hypothetical protein